MTRTRTSFFLSIPIIWILFLLFPVFSVLPSNKQARSNHKVASDLGYRLLSQHPATRVNVVFTTTQPMSPEDLKILRDLGGVVLYAYTSTNMYAARIPLGSVPELSELLNVLYVAPNRETRSSGYSHLDVATGASLVHLGESGSAGVTGKGIGIAVIDTGLYDVGDEFKDTSGSRRIVASRNFVGVDKAIHFVHQAGLYAISGGVSGKYRIQLVESGSQDFDDSFQLQFSGLERDSSYRVFFNNREVYAFDTDKNPAVNLRWRSGDRVATRDALPDRFAVVKRTSQSDDRDIALPDEFSPSSRISWITLTTADGQRLVEGPIDFPFINSMQLTEGSEQDYQDLYGHGTHVAGVAAGNGRAALRRGRDYSGVAGEAHLINLKALGDQGTGSVFDVLAAMDYAIRHKDALNIRIMNLSLGTVPYESYTKDPLCVMAEAAVDAGIVVVSAAGNYGKDAQNHTIYGGIVSPGNHPRVITVGAANTMDSDRRSDDVVASYSSRGPTLLDGLVKPDLVAPGNRIVSVRAKDSLLATQYDWLRVDANGDTTTYMTLSGTSVSAPVVSGAVALMLEANPSLTPAIVKALLMYTAEHMDGFAVYEQGAGQVNIEGAVRLARLIRPDAAQAVVGTPLLANGHRLQEVSRSTWIAGEHTLWGSRILFADGILFADDILTAGGILFADGTFFSKGILFADSTLNPEGIRFADGIVYADGLLRSDTQKYPDGILFDHTDLGRQGILFADGVVFSERVLFSDPKIFEDEGLWGSYMMDPVSASGVYSESVLAYDVQSTLPLIWSINSTSPYYPARRQ